MELVKRDSQKYEYAFETIVDKFGGRVDLEKLFGNKSYSTGLIIDK